MSQRATRRTTRIADRPHGRILAALFVTLTPLAPSATAQARPPVAAASPPPAALKVDPFYAKYVDADGIPVLGSARVPDAALLASRGMIHAMLRRRPELAPVLAGAGQRIAIMAPDEAITDLPEYRGWTKPARDDPRLTACERRHYDERIGRLSDRDYWNNRERAAGGLVMVDGAEDVLGLTSSRWYGETIFVHEFAHRILYAIGLAAPRLRARIEAAYRAALAKGRWRGEYAATSVDEYWAEGTQTWFNSNRIAIIDGRQILTDRDLKAYDPKLYATLRAVYGRYHEVAGDPFYNNPARVPPGLLPRNTAEQC